MVRHFLGSFIIFWCVLFAPQLALAKPHAPAEISIQGPSSPRVGESFTLTIELRGGVQPLPGRLTVRVPAGMQALSALPEFEGELQPGELHAFSLVVELLQPHSAALQVQFASGGTGGWRLGAQWSPAPRRIRTDRVVHPAAAPASRVIVAAVEDSITVFGEWDFRDRVQDQQGFVNESILDEPLSPVRFASVRLSRNDTLVATGETDSQGAFSFRVPALEGEYVATVTSSSSSRKLTVTDFPGEDLYTALSAGVQLEPGEDLDLGSLVIEAGAGAEGFNILDAMVTGGLVIEEITGSVQEGLVLARWGNFSTSSYSHGVTRRINLAADDAYDDAVILHEYGHYVVKQYSDDDSPQGPHFVNDDQQNPLLSWGEGVPSFWQTVMREWAGDPAATWYIDTSGEDGAGNLTFSYDCEEPSFPVRGVASEVVVQSALWDIVDGAQSPDPFPQEDDDALSLPLMEVWEVMTEYIPGVPTLTLEDFWTGWFSNQIGNVYETEMRDIFSSLGVELYEDTHEPDGSWANAMPLMVNGASAHHSFFDLNDIDIHTITVFTGQQITVETLNQVSWCDTQIQVFNPSFLSLAENDDREPGEDITSRATFTASEDGEHYVVVTRIKKGNSQYVDYGSYDVRAVSGETSAVNFTSSGGSAKVNDSGFGVGAAFADYDGDGDLDLVVVNNPGGSGNDAKDALYRNQGGGSFVKVTQSAGLGDPEGGVAAAWGDMDNDGDPDLFLSNHGLYRNDGGEFIDVTDSSSVADLGSEFDGKWADADNDGFLDLFVPVRDAPSVLWHNQGDGTFVDATAEFELSFPEDGGEAYTCAWGDFDANGWADLFVGFNARGDGHRLFRNYGDLGLLDVTATSGLSTSDAASGAAWADVNGDGALDLFVSSPQANKLYINQGDGSFTEEARRYGVDLLDYSRGAGFADFDLDGDLDLYISNENTASGLFENIEGNTFVRTDQAIVNEKTFGMAWGDYDGDGDPDAYLAVAGKANLLWRNTGSAAPWLKVELEGLTSNAQGIGARITVFAGDLVQVREMGTGFGWACMNAQSELFGVPSGEVDSVRVDWPSGARNVEISPTINTVLVVTEDESTPVLPGGDPAGFKLRLSAARPNPFAQATTLAFSLNRESPVEVRIFNLEGRLVQRLAQGMFPAGEYRLGWDGSLLQGGTAAPGVYFYTVRAGAQSQTRKLVRLR